MRTLTFKNKDNELMTLRIYSRDSSILGCLFVTRDGDIYKVADDNQYKPMRVLSHGEEIGLIEAGSIQIKHETVGYFTDIVGSSSLEFTLIAERNGQYRDLYTTSALGIKVELLKGDQVIYSGYLDSEIYEEDYNTLRNYPINFKAGNIKVLKRLDFDLNGKHSVKSVLNHCLNKLGVTLNYNSGVTSGSVNSSEFIIDTSIFYNDGEYSNCHEVIEKVLQSLNLRSMIIGNVFYCFDNSTISKRTPINMDSLLLGNAVLGSTECYKEVVYTLDTASGKEIFKCDIDKFEFPYPADSEVIVREKQGYEDSDIGFIQRVTNTKQFENITLLNSRVNVCRNSPRFSGSDEIYIKNNSIVRENTAVSIWKSKQMPITTLASDEWFLNLKLDVLLSIRSNPFRGVSEKEDCQPKTSWYNNHENDFRNHTNYTFVYADVFLYDEAGVITHYLKNTNSSREANAAEWITGRPSANGNFIFSFYANMKNEHGFDSGWQTNSPTVPSLGTGYSYGSLTKTMKNKGTLAKLPPSSGNIEVVIYEGVKCIDGADGGTIRQVYSDFKHLWYKDLKVSICDQNGHDNYSESDYEYRATLDNNAADTLTIDNKLGHIVDNDYSCRAGYTLSGKFVENYNYKGVTDALAYLCLSDINQTYNGHRNTFQTDIKPFDLMGSVLQLSDLRKNFFCVGFEYDPQINIYNVNLIEVA